ncbi:MAG: glycosyltransferase [Euryarchaeota archaeon]|nr:glycosyltransferase [Euryarchaeota archaeon]
MRRVLHVGPCNTLGGMAKVIEILSQNPPHGWNTDILDSHSKGNILTKLLAWHKARTYLKKHAGEFDIIHIHSAAGWSYKRKLGLARIAIKQKTQVIFHIHSGQFDQFAKQRNNIKNELQSTNIVVLSNYWQEKLQPIIGDCTIINNPIDPNITNDDSISRKPKQLLLLGRPDPVKGHSFAFDIARRLQKEGWELVATGTEHSEAGIKGLGWVSEQEKLRLLQESTAMLIPSKFEGQPLVMLEALAAGCPVIASDKIPELPPCVTSATHEDLDEWVKAINSVMQTDYLEYINAHQIGHINQKWSQIYADIIDN